MKNLLYWNSLGCMFLHWQCKRKGNHLFANVKMAIDLQMQMYILKNIFSNHSM